MKSYERSQAGCKVVIFRDGETFYFLLWIWNVGNFKTLCHLKPLHFICKKERWGLLLWWSPALPNTPLRLHTTEPIPTLCLAHVFLISYYEWKIHNYLFQTTCLFALHRACLEQEQELFLNYKSACMGWAMIDTGLLKKSILIE